MGEPKKVYIIYAEGRVFREVLFASLSLERARIKLIEMEKVLGINGTFSLSVFILEMDLG